MTNLFLNFLFNCFLVFLVHLLHLLLVCIQPTAEPEMSVGLVQSLLHLISARSQAAGSVCICTWCCRSGTPRTWPTIENQSCTRRTHASTHQPYLRVSSASKKY